LAYYPHISDIHITNVQARKVTIKFSLRFKIVTTTWRRMACWGIAPHILNLDTRWTLVISFTPSERRPKFFLDKSLSGTLGQPGRGGKENNFSVSAGNRPIVQPLYYLSFTLRAGWLSDNSAIPL
jgi:hypothetical protein